MSYIGTCTYDPADNKLRLTPDARLSKELYDRVTAAGFKWGGKTGAFIAPMWTPPRYDLAVELCGEVGDEDTSLADRAEERAERFGTYSEKRADEAARARDHVLSITDNIPFGQPILVGHHSERHARRDAERIDNGMRKAVSLWETSEYWKSRAAAARSHAKYKELPAVRHRRIKGLEADLRKHERSRDESAQSNKLWNNPEEELTLERALAIADRDYVSKCFTLADFPRVPPASQYEGMMSLWSALRDGIITAEQAREIATQVRDRSIADADRWIGHYELRIMYEKAMLAEAGGLVADKTKMEVGGRVLRRYGEWFVITRVNEASVSVVGHFAGTIPFDEIKEYKAPTADEAAAVKAATKQPPLCNYESEGCARMTAAEYTAIYHDHKSGHVMPATETAAEHRLRHVSGFIGARHGATGRKNSWSSVPVFITDAKAKMPPAPSSDAPAPVQWVSKEIVPRPAYVAPEPAPAGIETAAMKESLRAGVQVVAANQLFPTPPALAARMVAMLDAPAGCTVLEPSAGLGALVRALQDAGLDCFGVEIDPKLAQALANMNDLGVCGNVLEADFLTLDTSSLGTFDRIIMNPPFANADDIRHIKHALTMLNPGGRLVAICANGPRQDEQLKPLASHWEVLPPGTFAGTEVSAVLLEVAP